MEVIYFDPDFRGINKIQSILVILVRLLPRFKRISNIKICLS